MDLTAMGTALHSFAQLAGLPSTERAMLKALLGSTPVAISGHSTMIPIADLLEQIGIKKNEVGHADDGDETDLPEAAKWILKKFLTTPVVVANASKTATTRFHILTEFMCEPSGTFLHYQFNHMFLKLLHALAHDTKQPLF